jgi:hypothetical protein
LVEAANLAARRADRGRRGEAGRAGGRGCRAEAGFSHYRAAVLGRGKAPHATEGSIVTDSQDVRGRAAEQRQAFLDRHGYLVTVIPVTPDDS